MSRHQYLSRRRLQVWMAVNGAVLLALTLWVLKPSASGVDGAQGLAGGSATRPAVVVAPKDQVLALRGVRFGISAPQVPWSTSEVDRIATAAGARPTMLQFFVKWNQEFRPEAVTSAYQQGAVPIVSWEPWAGPAKGDDQPDFALAKIISGDFDAYVTRFATAVRDQQLPVAIRFAHEMNGNWHPWSESRSGNKPGEFAAAWRHVHDLFKQAGATNVIWLWSPNILRPVPRVSLSALYPGDAYVDWVGIVGYAVTEKTAAEVFDPTLTALRAFTTKPVVITETGVQPGAQRNSWIRDFFRWLPQRPDIIGFIWFEYSAAEGASSDWRFTANEQTAAAFRNGLRGVTLAPSAVVLAPG